MKSIRNILLAVLCGMSCSVVGASATRAKPQPFSFIGWVKNDDGMRVADKRGLDQPRQSRIGYGEAFLAAAGLLALGVGGLVGTGFITKKMVRVCKEAIVLKKQIQENPKDRSLRKNVAH